MGSTNRIASRLVRILALTALASFGALSPARADGIIHQLPADGTWVRYETTGEATRPGGVVTVSLKGTLTLKSVGRRRVDDADCRLIELESKTAFQRGEKKEEQTEVLKLLIPEKNLAPGQAPLAHVLKAWRREPSGNVRELDLKGNDASLVTGMDELLNAGHATPEKTEDIETKTPGGTFSCTMVVGKTSLPAGDTETQSWLTDKVPFGVAAYRSTKTRLRDGKEVGSRSVELKFAESGTGAKSDLGE